MLPPLCAEQAIGQVVSHRFSFAECHNIALRFQGIASCFVSSRPKAISDTSQKLLFNGGARFNGAFVPLMLTLLTIRPYRDIRFSGGFVSCPSSLESSFLLSS